MTAPAASPERHRGPRSPATATSGWWPGRRASTVLLDAATGAGNPVVSVGVEVDDAGNLDDVVIRRRPPTHSYMQAKYAVDSRTPVNGAYLTAPSRTGGPSILRRSPRPGTSSPATGDPVELAIVTNRAPDPADPLISGRDARTRLLLPRARAGGPASARGKARAQWAQGGRPDRSRAAGPAGRAGFRPGPRPHQLEETVKLTMFVAGLRSDEPALAAGTDWVSRAGRRRPARVRLDAIRDAIAAERLRAGPTRTIVSIATLVPGPPRRPGRARHRLGRPL